MAGAAPLRMVLLAAAAVGALAAANCSNSATFANAARSFAACSSLDGDTGSLAWTLDERLGTVEILFRQIPEEPTGWIAWGLSPDGRMPKSLVIAAFPNNSGGPPIIKQYSPLPPYGTPKLGTGLNVTRSAVEITTNAGTVLISLLFTLALPDNVSQHIWGKGPNVNPDPPYDLYAHAVSSCYGGFIDFSSGIVRPPPGASAGAQKAPAALVNKFNGYKPGKVVTKCTLPWGLPTSHGVTTIKAGTTCTWHWTDNKKHCVDGFNAPAGKEPYSHDDTGFGSNGLSGLGVTYAYTFLQPGFYPYYCCRHLLRMTGAILVLPKGKGKSKSTAPPTKAPPKATAGKPKKSTSKVTKAPSGSCVPACNGRCYGDQSLWWHMFISKESQQHQTKHALIKLRPIVSSRQPRKEQARQALLWTTVSVSLVRMDVTLCDLPGLKALDEYLLTRSYITRYQASRDDLAVYSVLKGVPSEYVNAARWYKHISALLGSSFPGQGVGVDLGGDDGEFQAAPKGGLPPVAADGAAGIIAATLAGVAAVAPATPPPAADEDDDDDMDLFEEETEEEKIARADREAAAGKSTKKESGKSSVLLDVKPWDDETDMVKLEELVRSIHLEGLTWGSSKLVAVGYGIKKLIIMMTIIDDLVSIDELIEDKLTQGEAAEYIQSCDIAAFNKI
eukprot:SM000094S24682  [mRNA]  locus=s94:122098:127047:+ [translate_table: standard]